MKKPLMCSAISPLFIPLKLFFIDFFGSLLLEHKARTG